MSVFNHLFMVLGGSVVQSLLVITELLISCNMTSWIWSAFFAMMSSVVVFGAPTGKDAEATIVSYEYQVKDDGYFFTYTTSNGITREENGILIRDPSKKGDDDEILRINGYYLYTDDNNKEHRVNYEADENGYRVLKQQQGYSATSFQSFGAAQPQSISTAALASLSGS